MHFQAASQGSLDCRHWTIVIWGASHRVGSSFWIPFVEHFPRSLWLECLLRAASLAVCLALRQGAPGKPQGGCGTAQFSDLPWPMQSGCPADPGCQQGLRVTPQPLVLWDLSLGGGASATLGLAATVTPCATTPPSPRIYLFWLDPVFDLQSVKIELLIVTFRAIIKGENSNE